MATEGLPAPTLPGNVLAYLGSHREFYAAVDRRVRVTPGDLVQFEGPENAALTEDVVGRLSHIDASIRDGTPAVVRLFVKTADTTYVVGWTRNTPATVRAKHAAGDSRETHAHLAEAIEVTGDD